MNVSRFKKLFQILIVLFSFMQLNSQNFNLAEPICNDNGTVTYSLYANVTNYLQHNNNLDKRNFFNKPSDLKDKKVGILPGFPIKSDDFGEVITYPNTEELINAIKNHTVDGI